MRERLTAAFIALAVGVLVLAGTLRLLAVHDLLRDQELAHLEQHAELISALVDDRRETGAPVTRAVLKRVVDPDVRLEYVGPGERSIVVTGAEYVDAGDDALTASRGSRATVRLSEGFEGPVQAYALDPWSLLMLALLVALLAGVAGWWLARRLAAPFQSLAGAAAALGRGRFDLELPDTRIPEARAIAEALRVSAGQLESRISRERELAEHASHVLRTPLTSLRLELEELTLRDDVPADVEAAVRRCIERVDSASSSAGELVALTRSGALVEGAETSLEELAHHVAQDWTNQLAGRRTVSAAVEGDLALRVTPGPIEQLLDLVLPDVKRGRGPVRLVFVGEGGHLRVRLPAGTVPNGSATRTGLEAATALAESQGGRITGNDAGGVEILLPRR
jgi:signal transduction histidine kinase